MLQGNMLQNEMRVSPNGFAAAEQAEANGIGEMLKLAQGFVRRQYLVVLLVALLGVAISVAYLLITPPTYTARAQILFGNPKAQFVQQQSVLAEAPVDVPQIESQIQILKSKATATAVIDQLKLADDPDFVNSDRSLLSFWQAIQTWFGAPQTGQRQAPDLDALLHEMERRLKVERVGLSTVIEISFSDSSAERAAAIANAIAKSYIADQVNAKLEANRAATKWLHDRVTELGHDALTAERAVDALKKKNNIVGADGKLMDEQQVADLNGRLVAARTQTADALARMNRYQTMLASNAANTDSDSISTLDVPGKDALNSPAINNLVEQYHDLAKREYEYSIRYGRNHMAVVNLRTAMKGIRASLLDEVHRLAESSKSDFEIAKQRQQEIEKDLAAAVSRARNTSAAVSSIRELEVSAKGYRTLYESFLQRYVGSLQQESFPIAEARVISPATPPEGKSKPKPPLVLALGIFGGIAFGMAIGLFRDIMDRAIRTSVQVESTLGLPCLSLVPLLGRSEQKRLSQYFNGSLRPSSDERTLFRSREVYWAASAMPLSRFTESIRSIRIGVDLEATKTSNKIVGITSTLPNEGKSTIAASLGQMLAHAGKRVVIVDCDLRNPSLSTTLSPSARTGIIEVLDGTSSLEETVWRDPKTNLVFLPVAKKAPLLHTSELLSAEQTKQLFDKLRASYDCIIVDLPPLAPIVDVRATAPLIDCFILVVEWGRTTAEVVQHALHAAPDVYASLIGTVINKADINAMKRHAAHYGDYYDNTHYARYRQLTEE